MLTITKDKKELIIKIPLWQSEYDAIDEYVGEVNNLFGVVATDRNGNSESGFYQAISLGYKDSIQLGGPIVFTDLEDNEFEKLCIRLKIPVDKYLPCLKCGEIMWGTSYDSLCFSCNLKRKHQWTMI